MAISESEIEARRMRGQAIAHTASDETGNRIRNHGSILRCMRYLVLLSMFSPSLLGYTKMTSELEIW
jgi:hypothetical protein